MLKIFIPGKVKMAALPVECGEFTTAMQVTGNPRTGCAGREGAAGQERGCEKTIFMPAARSGMSPGYLCGKILRKGTVMQKIIPGVLHMYQTVCRQVLSFEQTLILYGTRSNFFQSNKDIVSFFSVSCD
jgi:hypothetical protein